ncbi:MAG: DUF4468 domain-containing protein [Tannerellaceae bacterium]|nr:DUF4468 domain-containing protein [Tannerellaceae bacterium]
MKYTSILLLFIPFFLFAQNDTERNYLEGAVPEVNGKVVFTREMNLPGMSAGQIYDVVHEWASGKFTDAKNRIVYADKEKGDIAALGEEYIIFSSSALSLDRSLMSYRLTVECRDQFCKLSITGIKYEYTASYQREPEKYVAEEWITDKQALSKGKLNRVSGKFRRATVNYMAELFTDASAFISMRAPAVQPPAPVPSISQPTPVPPVVSQPAPVPATATTLDGYRSITPDRIPGNIVKMLSEDWMLITAGKDEEFNMMTASWGGLGVLFGKPVAICYINPARYTYRLMETSDTYTFTFYTEAYRDVLQYCGSASGLDQDKVKESGLTPLTTPTGSKAFGEAWMIIECRKMISQPLSTEVMNDPQLKAEWLGKQVHKMYIGEIINVWVK